MGKIPCVFFFTGASRFSRRRSVWTCDVRGESGKRYRLQTNVVTGVCDVRPSSAATAWNLINLNATSEAEGYKCPLDKILALHNLSFFVENIKWWNFSPQSGHAWKWTPHRRLQTLWFLLTTLRRRRAEEKRRIPTSSKPQKCFHANIFFKHERETQARPLNNTWTLIMQNYLHIVTARRQKKKNQGSNPCQPRSAQPGSMWGGHMLITPLHDCQ